MVDTPPVVDAPLELLAAADVELLAACDPPVEVLMAPDALPNVELPLKDVPPELPLDCPEVPPLAVVEP